MRDLIDRAGISISGICAVHCMITPVLIATIPSLGGIFSHLWIHLVILAFATPVAIYAFIFQGESRKITAFAVCGLLILFLAVGMEIFSHSLEAHLTANIPSPHMLNIIGGLILGVSHFLNVHSATQGDASRGFFLINTSK